MPVGVEGRSSGRGGGTNGSLLPEDRLRASVGRSAGLAGRPRESENGEGEGGEEGGSVGVGVAGLRKRVAVCSEGCTNGFSDAPEEDPTLARGSSTEGRGEWSVTLLDASMSSRGTPYPSRAVSCDLRARVLPGPAETLMEPLRRERTRLAVRVTLERKEGPEVDCADSRSDFRRRRSASSHRLRVCPRTRSSVRCCNSDGSANASSIENVTGAEIMERKGTYLFDFSRFGNLVGRRRVGFVRAHAVWGTLVLFFVLLLQGLLSLSF